MVTPEDTVRAFVAAINRHDAKRLVSLGTPGHRFIDSLGTVLTGRDKLHDAWVAYFDLFPDYRIEISSLLASEGLVLMTGWASGTLNALGAISGSSWRIPAAWRAEVRGEQIDSWQVFADNKPVYQLLQRDV